MGKRGKKFGGGRARPTSYTPVVRENEQLQEYYDSLGLVPEDEREQFWEALRRDLPNSFRFTGSRRHALAVQERLKDFYIPNMLSIEYEGVPVEPPRPLPWYPDQLAWAMTTPRKVVRRFPPFASFQKYLVSETEVGNISRQEVVSMIPPLLMDVKPGMVVLDLCAAPGSKSAQIMEMIHAGEEDRMEIIANKRHAEGVDDATKAEGNNLNMPKLFPGDVRDGTVDDDGRSTGLLIANDSDYKRAHLLIHQMKRLNSPNLIVTNHDATMYPSIKLPSQPAPDGKLVANRYLKFDRILADVPCSGDGTLRKNVSVWKDWNPANALGLHATQGRILVRALQMLKVGGRVVYSTCSMNPIENEAVIASVVDRCGGSSKVEIVDCSDQLPSLKRSPGLTTWSVIDKQSTWQSWSEFEKENTTTPSRVAESMFPPAGVDRGIDLTRCMRVNPHQQDTGAFFITVLEKKSEIKARPENVKKEEWKPSAGRAAEKQRNWERAQDGKPSNSTLQSQEQQKPDPSEDTTIPTPKRKADQLDDGPVSKRPRTLDEPSSQRKEPTDMASPSKATSDTVSGEATSTKPTEPAAPSPQKKTKSGQPVEEPFKYIDPNLEEIQNIFNFYDISLQFPRDRFMVRNAEGRLAKTVYYTSALGREILTENEGSGMKFVHCGIKMFVKQDVQKPNVCPWRIQTDGLQILASWVGSHKIVAIHKKETLRRLLIEMFPKVSDEGWKELGEIGEWARDAEQGCCVLRIEPTGQEDGFEELMIFPLWRSNHSLNLMLPKEDRRALLIRLFDDNTPLINTTAKREAAKTADPNNEQPSAANGDAETETGPGDLPSKEEEDAIKRDNLVLGQEEQDAMSCRESFVAAGDEQVVMNTTV